MIGEGPSGWPNDTAFGYDRWRRQLTIDTVTFEDGSNSEFAAMVWATGFKVDRSSIDIASAKDEQGHILRRRGVTPSPGLYTLGLSWQHTRASALLGWVGDDAAYLGGRIARSPTIRC